MCPTHQLDSKRAWLPGILANIQFSQRRQGRNWEKLEKIG